MAGLRVLICDDEESICALLRDILARFGHEAVVICGDGPSALARAEQELFDVVFLDIRMPGMDGVEVMHRMRPLRPEAKFVMITGYAQDELMDKSVAGGAYACLAKPFSLARLKKLLEDIAAGEAVGAEAP